MQVQSSPRARDHIGWLAWLWAFSEATFFFIVPDVLFTMIAVRNARKGYYACVSAIGGALIGGFVMWCWGYSHESHSLIFLDWIPAIRTEMIADVAVDLQTQGYWALFLGPLTGTPYKIYAVQAGWLGMSGALFILFSIPARAIRFFIVTWIADRISRAVGTRMTLKSKCRLTIMLWILFYAWYLIIMAG